MGWGAGAAATGSAVGAGLAAGTGAGGVGGTAAARAVDREVGAEEGGWVVRVECWTQGCIPTYISFVVSPPVAVVTVRTHWEHVRAGRSGL